MAGVVQQFLVLFAGASFAAELARLPSFLVRGAPSGWEMRIEAALDESTTQEFVETPLVDVVDHLKHLHDIEIQLDERALDDVGIGTNTPVTHDLKGISLRSALRLVLRELDLVQTLRDEVLSVSTPAEVQAGSVTRVNLLHGSTERSSVPSRSTATRPTSPGGPSAAGRPAGGPSRDRRRWLRSSRV